MNELNYYIIVMDIEKSDKDRNWNKIIKMRKRRKKWRRNWLDPFKVEKAGPCLVIEALSLWWCPSTPLLRCSSLTLFFFFLFSAPSSSFFFFSLHHADSSRFCNDDHHGIWGSHVVEFGDSWFKISCLPLFLCLDPCSSSDLEGFLLPNELLHLF